MPNRVLRDWTTSEPIDKLSLGAEVFFTRLIIMADDHGNYTANAKLIKAALFPLKDGVTPYEVEGWIDECVGVGIIVRYQVDEKNYLNIPNFGQRLRQMRSSYPQPAVNPLTSGCQPADYGRPETKRNEVETESETKAKTREWFNSCIDEIFRETLTITHKGKNVDQAIAEAWAFLSSEPQRLHNAGAADVKKLVNTWLGNMKEGAKSNRVKLL